MTLNEPTDPVAACVADFKNRRVVVGWSNDKLSAENMGRAAIKRPSWNNPMVTDRQAIKV